MYKTVLSLQQWNYLEKSLCHHFNTTFELVLKLWGTGTSLSYSHH